LVRNKLRMNHKEKKTNLKTDTKTYCLVSVVCCLILFKNNKFYVYTLVVG